MFRAVLLRAPSAKELSRSLAHLEQMIARHGKLEPPPRPSRKPLVRSLIGEYTGKRFDYPEEGELSGYEENLHPADVGPATRALAELALALFNSNELAYVY